MNIVFLYVYVLHLKPKGDSAGGVLVEERGFLVLTDMPRSVLGESCTTSLQDFAIFPSHQKKKIPKHFLL